MRADDDLGGGIVFRLGSARVSRAGFGVTPKRTSLPAIIFLRPDPWIILILLSNTRLPWIPQNVFEFLG